MSKIDVLVERMAQLVGISPDYSDAFGRSIETSQDTKVALLKALGLRVDSEVEARRALARLEKLKAGPVPAVIPVVEDRPVKIPLRGQWEGSEWSITEEIGTTHGGRLAKNDEALALPALPTGYHRLRLGTFEATVIAAPDTCWQPDALRNGKRFWGVTAQIYSLRSKQDLGIGDYSDVAHVAEGAGTYGAAFLGLSPVHALFTTDRAKISPYSPSSRLFLESLYIDPAAVEGFAESGARAVLDRPDMQERLSHLQGSPLIDYQEAWALKRPLLDALWKHFQSSGEDSAFQTFRREGGEALEAHATFEALSEHFRERGIAWIGEWPEAFRDMRSDAVVRFRSEQKERISYYAWLQWLADKQLSHAAEKARTAGLAIGLYRDLAVGADGSGSEVWATPDRFARDLAIGAPPDPLGPQGQNWGLPPFNPLTLEEQGLAAFRDLIAANMRHAGAIRIDHAFQLQRLFLIPSGALASQGAYVDYPFEAMLAVLRLESHRARCLVIAEDLGTAPEGFSDAIMQSGVLSYRVLPFERKDVLFKKPEDYPRSALAVLTTHDLPTFIGWWRGLDIDLRQTLGVFDPNHAEQERSARVVDKRHLTEALADEGLIASRNAPAAPPLEGAVRYLARTRSVLAALQIEDASGELNQPNMPGMDVGHPNWRRRLSHDIETIMSPGGAMAKLSSALAEEGRGRRPHGSALASPPPRATYRLQFHKDFTFDDAVKIVPYLANLGISHVYSSPIQAASPSSTHGYDIVDHSVINPELGGEEGFIRLSDALNEHGLKLLLDIVPNHMGVGSSANGWWMTILEWGRLSPVAAAFDIDWERPGAQGKLIVPILGGLYGEVLERGELQLTFDEKQGSFSITHWDHRLPVCPLTYAQVLDRALAGLDGRESAAALLDLLESLQTLKQRCVREDDADLQEEAEGLKRRLASIVAEHPEASKAISRTVRSVNGFEGMPQSFNALHRLLEAQPYRLAYWRVASSDINYRRFFDINDLAGIRVEIPEIFARTHELVVRLVKENRVHGLRIDHIDGLADPWGYTRSLQDVIGPGFYIAVEKILEPGEELRTWPVAGTTGYDVLNQIDGVLVDENAGSTFERIYRDATGCSDDYEDMLRQAKLEIIQANFASELGVLVADIKTIADASRQTRDYTTYALRHALVEIIAVFPVYRSYLREGEPSADDIRLIEGAVSAAKQSSALPDRSVHDFIGSALFGRVASADPVDVRRFRRHFQQLTGPVMAKSLEDTLFYRYARLIALNEVGGDPGHFGSTLQGFHENNATRARAWPFTMIATATHDTKRGEDARARLLALSEMPTEWEETIEVWCKAITPHLTDVNGCPAPDRNDQIILLQALLGAWPLELLERDDNRQLAAFQKRMEGYWVKALREAKRRTSWVSPNEPYEKAALTLLGCVLDPKSRILERLRPLARSISLLGMLNGLLRTVLKMTLPGVPDIYQGTEFWDFSLVDPDNRRPVDYEARAKSVIEDLSPEKALQHWQDGRIKQHLLAKLLQDRAASPALYANGDYTPLAVEGEHASHVIAFIRQQGEERLVVLAPRLWRSLIGTHEPKFDETIWNDMKAALPQGRWRNVITGAEVTIRTEWQSLAEFLSAFPFAVLRQVNEGKELTGQAH